METKRHFPAEVWVVVGAQDGGEFVSTSKQGAMEHAIDCSEVAAQFGPWRVARYVLETEPVVYDEDSVRAAFLIFQDCRARRQGNEESFRKAIRRLNAVRHTGRTG